MSATPARDAPEQRRVRHWREMTAKALSEGAARERVAILPLSATEAHGPHLPVGTDAIIGDGLVRRCAAALAPDSAALFLAQHEVGLSTEHMDFAGTVSLDAAGAVATIMAMGEAVSRAGCERMILVTAHGGNRPAMDIAARRLRRERGLLTVQTTWEALGDHATIYDYPRGAIDVHGGERETSLMLAIRPDLVALDEAVDFPSRQERRDPDALLALHSAPATQGWLSQDLNPQGVVGDASLATAAKGEAEIATIVRGFRRLVEEVAAAAVPARKPSYPPLRP